MNDFNENSLSKKEKHSTLILLFHAMGFACFALVWFLMPISFELESFDKLIISQATAHGVDIGLRVHTFYKVIFSGLALISLFFFSFRILFAKISFDIAKHGELMLFSAAIICLSFLQVMGIESLSVLKIINAIFWLRLILLLPVGRWKDWMKPLKSTQGFSLCLIYAFLMLFATFFLLGDRTIIYSNITWSFLMLVLFCMGVYMVFYHRLEQQTDRIPYYFLPLAAIPLLAFLSLESVFFIKESFGFFIGYKRLFVVLFFMSSLAIAWYIWKSQTPLNPGKLTRLVMAPSAIFAFVLLVFYNPIIPQNTELFELANPANALMQVFVFGEIPLLDFMSSHMLSEQWYGNLYSLLFGYSNQLNFLVYQFFNTLIFYLILYTFLNRLFHRPLLSVFFILVFPFTQQLFFGPAFIAIIPFFFAKQLFEKPTSGNFLLLWIVLMGLILWRIDTGVVGLLATLVFIPLLWILSKKRFPINAFIKGTGFFVLILAGVAVIAFLLRSPEQIITNFTIALHYVSANQAHGYQQLFDGFAQQFFVYHVLFPFVAIACSISIMVSLKRKKPNTLFSEGYLLLAALFLFILFFANAQRGLVRHGFAEQSEYFLISTFFAALALMVVHWSRASAAVSKFAVFYIAGFLIFMLFKFFPLNTSPILLEKGLKENALISVGKSLNDQDYMGRMQVDELFAARTYSELKTFLDTHLTAQQTFLDFSNTPMLYYYCNRKIPGYFNQNLQNTVDDFLQSELIKQLDPQQVPVVVYSNYPPTWFDATDGIANTLRYYLVAEHIFYNYEPYGIISNKSIWISKNFVPLPDPAEKDTLITNTVSFSLGLIPQYTGLFFSNNSQNGNSGEGLQVLYSLDRNAFEIHNDTLIFQFPESVLKLPGYLSIDFHSPPHPFNPTPMVVGISGNNSQEIASFSFLRRDNISSNYLIRLSNHYFWYQDNELNLRIPYANSIEQVTFLKDTRFENQ